MSQTKKKLGTFEGVFTPAILTILGVILFLRLGWVVGSVGIIYAFIIIILSHIATITTGLSMSSITTNVKIGAGGFYSIISRSLGLEIGGSIGILLYLSQTIGCAFYIIGFTEVWMSLYPNHNPMLVSTSILGILFLLSFLGPKLAMKTQYIIMGVIVISLFSFVMGQTGGETQSISFVLDSPPSSFWMVFAIFFPAVTGIDVGVAMSGDLKKPSRSIPFGLLTAIGLGLVLYLGIAFLLALKASPKDLMDNTLIMKELSLWNWAFLAGVMGATFSSALGTIVGGPRILMALGQDKLVPFFKTFGSTNKRGEPIFSLLFTVLLIETTLMLGDLNSIAPLLTMFFLITYGIINLTVFIEKSIGITSFRPTFKVPNIIPLIGAIWCLTIMFLINVVAASLALVLSTTVYILQVKRNLAIPWSDVRGAFFNSIAEWAVKKSASFPVTPKSWKPNLMIPIDDPKTWIHFFEFVKDIVYPTGTLRLFSVKVENQVVQGLNKILSSLKLGNQKENVSSEDLEGQLYYLAMSAKESGIFTTHLVIEANHFLEGISIVTQTMSELTFPPNVIFFTMSHDASKDETLEKMIAISVRESLGIIILAFHQKMAFGKKEKINIWLRDASPNKNLAFLIAIELLDKWESITLVRVANDDNEAEIAKKDLQKMVEMSRLPSDTETTILVGSFKEVLPKAPLCDINIFGISNQIDCDLMHHLFEQVGTSCLFIKDSGEESLID